jgi:hypothetical protein
MNPRAIATALILTLGCTGLCLASEARRKAAEDWWNFEGNRLRTEIASLSVPGRTAFRDALIACTLYLEESSNAAREDACQKAEKLFVIEHTSGYSAADSAFKMAMINAKIDKANHELEYRQGKFNNWKSGDDFYYAYLDVLQRAYRETGSETDNKGTTSGSLSDAQIATIIVRQSRGAYYASGHPCACPEDLARDGSRCGRRSAASRPGGAAPYCYPSDVPRAEIEGYRARH